MTTEPLRVNSKPETIDMLLVGELLPRRGKFFYGTCASTTFIRRPFEAVHGLSLSDSSGFLPFLKAQRAILLTEITLGKSIA